MVQFSGPEGRANLANSHFKKRSAFLDNDVKGRKKIIFTDDLKACFFSHWKAILYPYLWLHGQGSGGFPKRPATRIMATNGTTNAEIALFFNTAKAHALDKTEDWGIIYFEKNVIEGQSTVVTETSGVLKGKRVVRGRESETPSDL